MSIPAALELASELRRLAAAGVALGRGDRRVRALVPLLEASGARAPVFAALAAKSAALIEAPKAEAATRFLELNTLVGAVLKTQGATGLEGELAPLPRSCTEPKPLTVRTVEALGAGAEGGRREALDDALERGLFGDARLAPFALEALRSDSAEIANLAASRMLPAYGAAIVPLLVASLDPTEKRAAARTIEAIRGADPASGAAVARALLDPEAPSVAGLRAGGAASPDGTPSGKEPSDEAIVAALGCLEDTDDDRALLEGALSAKRKPVRVAALRRLLEHGDAGARAHATAMLGGSATKAREAVEALPALEDPDVATAVVARARTAADGLDAAAAGGAAPTAAETGAALALLALLARSAPDAARFDAALRLCAHAHALGLRSRVADPRIDGRIGEYLIANCPSERHAELVAALLAWKPHGASIGLIRHFGTARALALLRAAGDPHLVRNLHGAYSLLAGATYGEPFPDVPAPPVGDWDVGWLDLALEHREMALARPLAKGAPERVVETALAMPRVHDDRVVLTLLVAPERAGDLLERLTGPANRPGPVRAVCEALAAGDRKTAGELAARASYGRDRVDGMRELHARLARDAGAPD